MLTKMCEGQFSVSDDVSGRFGECVLEKSLHCLGRLWGPAPREKRGWNLSGGGGHDGAIKESSTTCVQKRLYIGGGYNNWEQKCTIDFIGTMYLPRTAVRGKQILLSALQNEAVACTAA